MEEVAGGEKVLKFKCMSVSIFSDGSISRSPHDPPPLPASPSFGDAGAATKDVALNLSSGTWARIFLPHCAASAKLPTLLYFHGGGFCDGSTALPDHHRFLCKLAAASNTLIVSVDYRLAPEHRLPAAYDDCFDALIWLHEQAKLQNQGKVEGHGIVGGELAKLPDDHGTVEEPEPWLAAHADFSKCFLGGDSAGGNITHHVAMRAASQRWEYLSVQGMILIHPFFSSEVPTGYELRNPGFAEAALDLWKLCLPVGVAADRDHPASNPIGPAAPSLADACLPRALVAVASMDQLRDRGVEYFEALRRAGKEAKLVISENEGHVFHLLTPDSENVPAFLKELADFLNQQDS